MRLLVSFLLCCGPAPLAVFAGDEAIPFREAWGWAVVLKVQLGGSGAHDFLLDTGATSTILEPALAEQLGIKPWARTNLVTPAGVRAVVVGRTTLTVGATTLPDVEVLIGELPAIRGDEARVRGILGQSALAQLEYTIDHARRRVVVHRRHAAVAAGPDGSPRPTLEARPGCGPSTARFVLDSGVATPVLFEQGRPGDLALGRPVLATTNAGEASWREGRLASLCVAGRRAAGVDVVVRPETASARAEDGLLPTRFFSRVRLGPGGSVIGVVHWP